MPEFDNNVLDALQRNTPNGEELRAERHFKELAVRRANVFEKELVSSTALLVRLRQEADLFGFNADELSALNEQIDRNRSILVRL